MPIHPMHLSPESTAGKSSSSARLRTPTRARTGARAALFLAALALGGCSHLPYPGESVKFKAWNVTQTEARGVPDSRLFPEQQIPELEKRKDIGIAFFGGGNRAATAALGQLRALDQIGLLSQVRYISSVSGGTWCAGPYSFVPPPKDTSPADLASGAWVKKADHDFFGDIVPPGKLDPGTLDLSAPHFPMGSFAALAGQSHFDLLRLFRQRGDKNYAYVLSRIYLHPLKLDHPHRFIAYDSASIRSLLAANPQLAAKDFQFCAPHRPYLIAGATIAMPWHFTPGTRYYPIQLTPNYIGTRAMFPLNDKEAYMGGGFVQSAGYDSLLRRSTADRAPGQYTVAGYLPPRLGLLSMLASPRFSLSDMLATSGAAPTVPAPELAWVVGFPQFLHWAPGRLGSNDIPVHKKVHTDGGGTDDSGVAALVTRDVHRIICFANADMSVPGSAEPQMADELRRLFGVSSADTAGVAHIFRTEDFAKINAEFTQIWKQEDSPIITSHLVTVPNRYFGIKGGRHITVTWVFLGPPADFGAMAQNGATWMHRNGSPIRWYQDLNQDTKTRIAGGWKNEFGDFPYYKTFFQNSGGLSSIIYLSPEQVNALSQFTTYVVLQNREKLLHPH